MSATYAGDPNNYPTSLTKPSDGDFKPAASVDVMLEGLADRTAWLEARNAVFEYHDNALAFLTQSVTAVLVTGYELSVPSCKVGDLLVITWNATFYTDAGYAEFFPTILDGATDTAPIGSKRTVATSLQAASAMSFTTVWTVATAGTFKARGKLAVDNAANTARIQVPASIVVQRHRPLP